MNEHIHIERGDKWGWRVQQTTPRGDVLLAVCRAHSDAILIRDYYRSVARPPAHKRRRRANPRSAQRARAAPAES